MRNMIKWLFRLLVFVVALLLVNPPFSPKNELEKRIVATMQEAGLSDVSLKVENINTNSLSLANIRFKKDDIIISAEQLQLETAALPYAEMLKDNYDNVAGKWRVSGLTIQGVAYPFPVVAGEGELYFMAGKPAIKGDLKSTDAKVAAAFEVNRFEAKVLKMQVPWEGANIYTDEPFTFSFIDPTPVYVVLRVANLRLERLLNLLTSDKASGTGVINGSAPVVFAHDGGFMPGETHFEAKEEGKISISPEALPGDNPQMQMAREALTDFTYSKLLLTSKTDEKGKLSVSLQIAGHNPNFQEGRPVNLNVNLTGDVLELLEQTLLPSADPKKFLERNNE